MLRAAMASRTLLLLLALAGCGARPTDPAAAGDEPAGATTKPRPPADPKLLDPDKANARAPDIYRVKFDTTKGDFVIEVVRAWAPIGADRFYNLVQLGFFDDVAFFRAIEGFMVQFGLHGHPDVSKAWRSAQLADDPRKQPNAKGTISFANKGKNTRTTQVFINYNDNAPLDEMGFAPFGRVVEGMEVVMSLHTGYGEGAPRGPGPDQVEIERQGNDYLRRRYPNLDWIEHATIVPAG